MSHWSGGVIHPMEISVGDIVCLNICAHIVAKVVEYVGGGANGMQTLDPALRTLKAPSNMWRQGRIPRLDCEDDSYLDTVVVMPVLLDAQHLHSPSPHMVASLNHNPKLIHIIEPPLWHLKNAKGGRAIPESPHLKLNIRLLRLVAFGRSPLFCYVKHPETFRNRLTGLETPPPHCR